MIFQLELFGQYRNQEKNPKICHSLETAKKNLKIPAKWNSTVVEKDR